MARLQLTEGDTGKPLVFTVKKADPNTNNAPEDLSDVDAVELILSLDGTQTNAGHTAVEIVEPTNGACLYDLQNGDLPSPGEYVAQVFLDYGLGGAVDGRDAIYESLNLTVQAKEVS